MPPKRVISPQLWLLQVGQAMFKLRKASVVTFSDIFSPSLSARKRPWHSLHSTSGSENVVVCPDATHVLGFMMIAASTPYISSRNTTKKSHQHRITFCFKLSPSGP